MTIKLYMQHYLIVWVVIGSMIWGWGIPGLQAQQQATVYLSVQDIIDLAAVSGAEVQLFDAEGKLLEKLSTDERGRCKLPGPLPAQGRISVLHADYLPLHTTLAEARQQYFRFFLESKTYNMEEVVFTANKFQEKKEDIPFQIEVINAKTIAFQNPQTSADLLMQQGSVFVQKSQQGGGSPNLRGFEANKVLIVIDGVRMNNAIYRSGHLQNVITIDPNMVERTEVMFGPGSVIYGSDALGGVMHFYSRKPELSGTDKPKIMLNTFGRFATANREKTFHADLNVGLKKWGFLSSFSFSDFDDLRVGNVRPKKYPDFGKRFHYQLRENGQDVMKENDRPNLQRFSGYSQYDFTQKVLFAPGEQATHTLNIQYSTSSNIPRFDRLSQYRAGRLRYAEWHYGPQKRFMGSYRLKLFSQRAFYDQFSLTAAYQSIEERRISRDFGNEWQNNRIEQLDILSLNLDAIKELPGRHELAYGLEGVWNGVASSAFARNIDSGERRPLDTRYPDGGSDMRFLAAYFSHRWELSEQWILTDGFRLSDVGLVARFKDTTFYAFPFHRIDQQARALSGNLGLVFKPAEGWRLSLLASTGFRAPNLDDVAKVFDSQPGNVVVPNPQLKPEYTYNAEATLGKQVGDWFKMELTGFYTLYDNAIVVRPYTFNGQDSIWYDGQLSRVQANVNARQAFITGFNINFWAEIQRWSFMHTLSYTYGQDLSSQVPLDHIPPLFGRGELRYKAKRIESALSVAYNAWKRLNRFSPRDLNNLAFATPEGNPAWWTLNLHLSYALSSRFKLQLAVENILDHHYRPYASRFSAPGRNVLLAVRAKF
ncbi:MAG: TonB-dependent receptor [Bacteroidetes bacterium]|nr:MAG: TonB-dependent receptor [Bacteroidota bacterium]